MNILDPRFKYVPAAATDVAKTFKRIRKEQREQAETQQQANEEAQRKVRKLGSK